MRKIIVYVFEEQKLMQVLALVFEEQKLMQVLALISKHILTASY